jgi:ABC-type multidrug transport system ATPase subunit
MAALSLIDCSFASDGPAISLALEAGESLCVLGPAGSGKSKVLAAIAEGRPAKGLIERPAHIKAALDLDLPRKATPINLARHATRNSSSHSTHILTELRLWERRTAPTAALSPSAQAACALLDVLGSSDPSFVIDGLLDLLDPWALAGALGLLQARLSSGAIAVIGTNRPDIASRCTKLLVLKRGGVLFSGTPQQLIQRAGPMTLEVETTAKNSARALVDPLDLSVESSKQGLKLQAVDGQALAARLLTEGYGDVRAVVLRAPSFEEALLMLE